MIQTVTAHVWGALAIKNAFLVIIILNVWWMALCFNRKRLRVQYADVYLSANNDTIRIDS